MKNKKVYGLVGVAALAAVGGTFAYYSAEQTFSNPFKTTYYSTQATEKFNPTGDNKTWKPGAKIDKDVTATNTGEGEVWVRVKFDEVWRRGNAQLATWDSEDETFLPATPEKAADESGNLWQWKDNRNGKLVEMTKPDGTKEGVWIGEDDGKTETEDGAWDKGSVVFKEILAGEDSDWTYGGDGYYYYKYVLAKGDTTSKILDSVTLCGDTDMGKFQNSTYIYWSATVDVAPEFDKETWTEVPADKTVEEFMKQLITDGEFTAEEAKGLNVFTYQENVREDGLYGYSEADYDLNITVEFVQSDTEEESAYEAAIAMGWGDANKLSNLLEKTIKPTAPAPTEPETTPAANEGE